MIDTPPSETTKISAEKRTNGRDWKVILQRTLALVFAATITIVIFAMRDTIEDYAVYGYPGVFVISLLGNATLILPAPSFLIVFALAGVLNPILMGIAAGTGAAIGEMTGFLAGFGGRGTVEDKPLYRRLERLMRRYGAWIVFVLAFIPNPVFDVGGILAGILKMPWWKFLLAAAIGKSIRFVLVAYFGEAIL